MHSLYDMDQEEALNLLIAVLYQIDLKPLAKSLQRSLTITEEPTMERENLPEFESFLSQSSNSRRKTCIELCSDIILLVVSSIQWLSRLPVEYKWIIFLALSLVLAISKMVNWNEYECKYECKYDWEKDGQYQSV